jgi:hypothetical protein
MYGQQMLLVCLTSAALIASSPAKAPSPLLENGQAVDWWFGFKFNTATFSECGTGVQRSCLMGGTVQLYKMFGMQFAYASSIYHTLKQGGGCFGDTINDPLGATANEVYKGKYFYVLWNDQFYGDPIDSDGAPAGHSKGMLAWNKNGDGLLLQVSTPSWPGSGSSGNPRASGNTLGCIKGDNNILLSQHFFALKLTKSDVIAVLTALENSSVVTDPSKAQIVRIGGPPDIQALVKTLGTVSASKTATKTRLSSGVSLVSKPSHLNFPPWQMVSAVL